MADDTPTPDRRPQRSEPQAFRSRQLSAGLTVDDLQTSLDWYCDRIGFHLEQTYEFEGEVRGASLVAGDVHLVISQDDGAKGTDRKKGQGIRLYFSTVQDIDKVAADIETRGGTLASRPEDKPWGVRAFDLVDPDGFLLTISSPLEDGGS